MSTRVVDQMWDLWDLWDLLVLSAQHLTNNPNGWKCEAFLKWRISWLVWPIVGWSKAKHLSEGSV